MTRRRVTDSPRLLTLSVAALALPLLAVPAAGAPFLDRTDAEVFWPGSTSAAMSTISTTAEEEVGTSHADDVRAQADAILAMDLTSRENLARAWEEGVSTGTITRLVGQLRSGNPAVVERALEGLARMDRQHEAQTTS